MPPWQVIDQSSCSPGDMILWDHDVQGLRTIRTEPELRPGGHVQYILTTRGKRDVDTSMPWKDLRNWLMGNRHRTLVLRRRLP